MKIRSLRSLLLSSCLLTSACSFLKPGIDLPTEVGYKIAADSANKLASIYPPASTSFNFDADEDAIGQPLAQQLRDKGFAIGSTGLPLNCVADQIDGTNLYRVMIGIGNGTLSRAYVSKLNDVKPAGAWASSGITPTVMRRTYPHTLTPAFADDNAEISPLPDTNHHAGSSSQRTKPKTPIAKTANTSNAGLTHIGASDVDITLVKRRGNDVPLPAALKAIAPKTWHANVSNTVNRNAVFSWSAGDDWITTLGDFADEAQLAITVDWDEKRITVGQPEDEPIPSPIPAPVEANLPAASTLVVTAPGKKASTDVSKDGAAAPDSASVPATKEPAPIPSPVSEKARIPEKTIDTGPAPVTVSGFAENCFEEAAKRWGKKTEWKLPRERFSIGLTTLTGKSFQDDFMAIAKLIETNDIELAFDAYENNVPVLIAITQMPKSQPYKSANQN